MTTKPHPAAAAAVVMCLTALSTPLLAQPTQVKPGFNVFSVEQDVEIGRQSAAEAERQLPVLNDRRADGSHHRGTSGLGVAGTKLRQLGAQV